MIIDNPIEEKGGKVNHRGALLMQTLLPGWIGLWGRLSGLNVDWFLAGLSMEKDRAALPVKLHEG